MKDQSNDPSHHERTLLPQSYILVLLTLMTADMQLPTNHLNWSAQQIVGEHVRRVLSHVSKWTIIQTLATSEYFKCVP